MSRQLTQQFGRGLRLMPAREIALLIGGPKDGTRIEIEAGLQILRMVGMSDSKELVTFNDEPPKVCEAVYHDYLRTNFSMSNGAQMGRFALYLYAPLGRDAMIAVQHLILGYRSQEPIDSGAIMEAMHTLPEVKRQPWE